MKYLIKQLTKEQKFRDGLPVYGTGDQHFKVESCELFSKKLGADKWRYITGLNESDIQQSRELLQAEKDVYLSLLPSVLEKVKGAYGPEALDATNSVFWRPRKRFKLDHNTVNTVFDDEGVDNLIRRFHILAGGYPSIAASEDAAYRNGKMFYMVELQEFETQKFEDEFGSKLEAMGLLSDLVKKGSNEALLTISWILEDDVSKGYTRSTSQLNLKKYLVEFIEGKTVRKSKKDTPSRFIEAYNKWKSDKDGVAIELCFRVAVHFGVIYKDAKNGYIVGDNKLEIGKTEDKAIEFLRHPKNREEFLFLKELTDKKLE